VLFLRLVAIDQEIASLPIIKQEQKMKEVTAEEFSDMVSTMSINDTKDSGFAVTHFGLSAAGEKVIAISDMNGHFYLMTGPA
jgi:hypothetical protein